MTATLDYPSQVTVTTPTFLAGGDAALELPAKAACAPGGLAVLAAATAATARDALAFGTPSTEVSDRDLVAADNGGVLYCAAPRIFTVQAGHVTGFGVAAQGTCIFVAGAGVVITDDRAPGAVSPWCALVQAPVADTYNMVGTTI
jgi:hypothetical protein